MFVVDVTLHFLLGGKTLIVILACPLRTLERARMSLFVLGEVTFASEDFIAGRISTLPLDDLRDFALLAACH